MIHKSITNIIGQTPLVELIKIQKKYGLIAKVIAKLEFLNPSGSIKDRVALATIMDYVEKGLLNRQATIVACSSGNAGIGLAAVAAAHGYKLILTMPETVSAAQRNMLEAYGATVVLTDRAQSMKGAVEKAREIADKTKNSILFDQFENQKNIETHRETTGPEIWTETGGEVDVFVAGIGTGGTITGAGEYLRTKNSNIHIVGIEPAASSVLLKKEPGVHKIAGIGAGFVPELLNKKIYNEIIAVKDEDAIEIARVMAKIEGMLVGPSSGAAVWVAIQLALLEKFEDQNIVVILPDTSARYNYLK